MQRTLTTLAAAALLMLLAAGCTSTPRHASNQSQAMSTNPHLGRIRHVVMFRFTEDADPAAIARVEEAFAALPSQIPQIRDFEWGTNNSPEGLDMGYTHVFLVTFDNDADRAAYLPHPAHQEFVQLLGGIIDEVHVLDYTAQK